MQGMGVNSFSPLTKVTNEQAITTILNSMGKADEVNDLKADPNNFVQMTADQASITGQIFPPTDADGKVLDTDVINKFIVYVSWYDEADNILDNANDVVASKTPTAHGVINVNLNVTQLNL